MKTVQRMLLLVVTALLTFGLSGCLMSSESNTTIKGRNIGPATLAQIQPGRTKDFVQALLGEPTDRITVDEHTVLWRYKYTEIRNTTGGFIFIFGTNNHSDIEKNTYVEFKDDIVTKSWTE